jgi:hypothetical protein
MNSTSLYRRANRMRRILCRFFTLRERLALFSPLFFRLYQVWLGDLFEREIRLAQIMKDDRVLHIGCGPLPLLSYLVVERTRTCVHAIDQDAEAVLKAREYIRTRGLSDYITVIHAEATTYPLHEYTVIFLAINVTPIDGILRRLATDAQSGARIVCRDCGTSLERILSRKEFSRWFLIRSVPTQGVLHSFLLEKR